MHALSKGTWSFLASLQFHSKTVKIIYSYWSHWTWTLRLIPELNLISTFLYICLHMLYFEFNKYFLLQYLWGNLFLADDMTIKYEYLYKMINVGINFGLSSIIWPLYPMSLFHPMLSVIGPRDDQTHWSKAGHFRLNRAPLSIW